MNRYSLLLILFSLTYIALPNNILAQDNNNGLQDTIKVLTKKDKQIAEKKYNEGVIMLQSNKYHDAISLFDQALKVRVKFPEAFYNRASAKFLSKNYVGAIQDYNAAITLKPNAKYYLARAISRYKYNELPGAKLDLDKAISLDSGAVRNDAYYYKGCVQFLEKNYGEAIKSFTSTIENDDKYTFAYHDRGSCNRMLEKYQLALIDYRKAIQLDPNLSMAFNNIASVKKLMKDYQGAITDYTSAISVDTASALSYNNRGTVYKELEEYDKALADFNKAIKIDANYAIAYGNRANLSFAKKDYQAALLDYNKALELDANYGLGYLNRGICKEMLRDDTGACKDWSKADALGVSVAGDYLNAQCK